MTFCWPWICTWPGRFCICSCRICCDCNVVLPATTPVHLRLVDYHRLHEALLLWKFEGYSMREFIWSPVNNEVSLLCGLTHQMICQVMSDMIRHAGFCYDSLQTGLVPLRDAKNLSDYCTFQQENMPAHSTCKTQGKTPYVIAVTLWPPNQLVIYKAWSGRIFDLREAPWMRL